MPLVDSPFRPAWWLPGPHAQTLWAALARRAPRPPLRWEELELPDGDFLELAHVDRPVPDDAPTALVLHGLAGSVHSPHVAGVIESRLLTYRATTALPRQGRHPEELVPGCQSTAQQ